MDELEGKTEFLCPFCKDYVLLKYFEVHAQFHRNDPGVTFPTTMQEFKDRFFYLGMYEVR